MYLQTRGKVLSSLRYKETSIISKIYTAQKGIQSYVANGVRKKNGGKVYYQPLNIVELTAYYKKNNAIHRIREIKSPIVYSSIPFHVLKSSVALFLGEVLSKCLKEEEENRRREEKENELREAESSYSSGDSGSRYEPKSLSLR